MKRFVYVNLFCLSILGPISPQAATIERLTPPMLSEASVDQKISCTRPMRKGKFNISVEQKDGKILVHNYGHGGSGCTTSFGSVRLAIEEFERQFGEKAKAPVRVIGAGIIGLTTAIELKLKGYDVAGITAEERYEIPSWKNAGYFALVSVQTDPEEQERLNQIGMNTFLEYKKIHEGIHPYISKESVRYLPVYSSEKTEAGVEDLEKAGLIPKREYVTLDFGNGVTHPNFVKYMTYFMDTTRIMIELRATVDSMGIPVEERKVNSFAELNEEVIFNCAGLGAKSLNNDDQMVAVRGHLLNLNELSGKEHMDYMIYTKIKGTNDYVYMFPKALQISTEDPKGRFVSGTLGGTFIPNTDALSEEQLKALDEAEFRKLFDRNHEFFWGAEEGSTAHKQEL